MEQYASLDFTNLADTKTDCNEEIIKNIQQQQKKLQQQHKNKHNKYHNSRGFEWTPERQLLFARIVTKLGILNAKPRRIQKQGGHEFRDLSNNQISSHLQKYKMKLLKQYNLENYEQLKNQMFIHGLNDEMLQKIADKWLADKVDKHDKKQ